MQKMIISIKRLLNNLIERLLLEGFGKYDEAMLRQVILYLLEFVVIK